MLSWPERLILKTHSKSPMVTFNRPCSFTPKANYLIHDKRKTKIYLAASFVCSFFFPFFLFLVFAHLQNTPKWNEWTDVSENKPCLFESAKAECLPATCRTRVEQLQIPDRPFSNGVVTSDNGNNSPPKTVMNSDWHVFWGEDIRRNPYTCTWI